MDGIVLMCVGFHHETQGAIELVRCVPRITGISENEESSWCDGFLLHVITRQ